MDFAALLHALGEQAIRLDAFCMGSAADANEVYVISKEIPGLVGSPEYWLTYYLERGLKRGVRRFETEAAACNHFLEWVCADLTTHQH